MKLPLIAVLGGALALASTSRAAPALPPPPPECHQFDFWLGEWEVTNPAGKHAGSSRIESIAGGYGILENWEGAGGVSGKSINTYNPDRKQWQQLWVDASGAVIELAGGRNGPAMVLENAVRLPDGKPQRNRITWTPNPDGSVRQLWEQSADDGRTWQVAFDGLYRHRGK